MCNTCVVFGCYNRSERKDALDGKRRSYYGFPTVLVHQNETTKELSRRQRDMWISRVNRKGFADPKRHHKVCSDHFVTGAKAPLYQTSHPDWAPSLKLGSEVGKKSKTTTANALQRYKRTQERQEKKQKHVHVAEIDTSEFQREACTFLKKGHFEQEEEEETIEILLEPIVMESDIVNKLRFEIQNLTSENATLKEKVTEQQITEDSMKDDTRVKYYTGLPGFSTLMEVFDHIEDSIPMSCKSQLTKFQKVMLVFMKLRLNLSLQDLAYRFGTSKSNASRIFSDILHVMFVVLNDCIYWPDREELQLTMPMEFRKTFGLKVSIIIDCFEIFIERPSNLLARSETWSNYKHHNTIKFLIGITPQGAVSFLTKAWGGRGSDKHITENCGLLNKLLPGDVVLADRGFDIRESVGLMCAEVKIPSFTKGKQQLSPLEVEDTRKIAHSRIHVERVIGLVRNKFTILQSILPIDFLHCEKNEVPIIDKIATVCCALSNLCDSVVSFD